MAKLAYLILSVAVATNAQGYQYDCSHLEYERCVKIADPLVKEAHLIFPDNVADIDLVCRTWNKFVDCLKRYTDRCFTAEQRRKFNKAVENPIESVHKMCMQPDYQQEYLQYAPCIKSTVTDRQYCGPHYNLLVDQVSQGDVISKATLCCSHDRFKQCVKRETRRQCDRGVENGPASTFAGQIIDKALSFLQDQCYNYIPNSGDCTHLATDSYGYYSTDPALSTAPNDIYPWTNQQPSSHRAAEGGGGGGTYQGKEISVSSNGHSGNMPAGLTPPAPTAVTPQRTTSAWFPSHSVSADDIGQATSNVLGSRNRPSSYGRSGSWLESGRPLPDHVGGGNGAAAGGSSNGRSDYVTPAMTPPPRPDWASTNWHSANDGGRSTGGVTTMSTATETWYPAAGYQVNNEVDAPNQQGLSRYDGKSAATITRGSCAIVTIVALVSAVAQYSIA